MCFDVYMHCSCFVCYPGQVPTVFPPEIILILLLSTFWSIYIYIYIYICTWTTHVCASAPASWIWDAFLESFASALEFHFLRCEFGILFSNPLLQPWSFTSCIVILRYFSRILCFSLGVSHPALWMWDTFIESFAPPFGSCRTSLAYTCSVAHNAWFPGVWVRVKI